MVAVLKNLTEGLSNIKSGKSASETGVHNRRQLELSISHGWPDSGQVAWCFREDGRITAQGRVKELTDLPAEVQEVPVHVWTPAEDTLLTRVKMPTRSRSKILQALPYVLEDKLLEDPSDLFITYTRGMTGELQVSVTNRLRLKHWIEQLEQGNLSVVSITPISLSVSALSHAWVLYCHEGACWLRSGPVDALRCDIYSDEPPHILRALLDDTQERPNTLIVHNPPAGFSQDKWQTQLELEILVEQTSFWNVSEPDNLSLNLRQAEFALRRKHHGSSHRFRAAMVMASIWFIGTLAFTTYEWWQLQSEYSGLRAEMNAIFKKAFPRESILIVDPYKQMQANLALSGATGSKHPNDGFLPLIAELAKTLSPTEKALIKELSYQGNTLVLSLELTDYQNLERLKNTLASSRLKHSVTNVRQKDGVISASIKLEAN